MSFDATVGGANANSYVTLAYANSFFENWLLPNAWDDAVPDDQERALMTATSWLEKVDYIVTPATDTQALKWPGFSIFDTNGDLVADSSGTPALVLNRYDETEMPVPLMNTTCELAFYLLTLGAALGASSVTGTLGPVSSLKLGDEVEVRYGQPSAAATIAAFGVDDLPAHVARGLRGLRLPVVIA